MKYFLAPVQGHTDAPYRHFFAKNYGADNICFTTPFIRLEKGELRKKDLKDILSPLNDGLEVIPQVIFRDKGELEALVGILREEGFSRIDLNMGCPFPLQTSRGRGAASVGNPECIQAVRDVVEANPEISFSVKMRLGYEKEEWEPLIEALNTLKLDHISVHPRIAKEQYAPDTLHIDSFEKILEMSSNPIVYNGDILTPEDARAIMEKYPTLHGIMIGRGALGRPSIFREIAEGEDWDSELRLKRMKGFHRDLISYFNENLVGGDHQVLSKIQPFWEYAESEIGRKAWKGIRKASTISKYQTALAMIK